MTTMVSEVYEALRLAGVDEDRARRADEAMVPANNEPRLARIEVDIGRLQADVGRLQVDVGKLQADVGALKVGVALVQWMVGAVIAVLLSGGWLLLRVAAKVGAV